MVDIYEILNTRLIFSDLYSNDCIYGYNSDYLKFKLNHGKIIFGPVKCVLSHQLGAYSKTRIVKKKSSIIYNKLRAGIVYSKAIKGM